MIKKNLFLKGPAKAAAIVLGLVFTGIGILGVIMPVLPGTPFFLLALWFFARSSRTLFFLLLHNRYIGPSMRSYIKDGELPFKTKIIMLALLYGGVSATLLLLRPPVWGAVLLLAFIVAATFFIVRRSKRP